MTTPIHRLIALIALPLAILLTSCASQTPRTAPPHAGLYTGILPAASAPGIATCVLITEEDTYIAAQWYLEHPEPQTTPEIGCLTPTEHPHTFQLAGECGIPCVQGTPHGLRVLDAQGHPAPRPLNPHYNLDATPIAHIIHQDNQKWIIAYPPSAVILIAGTEQAWYLPATTDNTEYRMGTTSWFPHPDGGTLHTPGKTLRLTAAE